MEHDRLARLVARLEAGTATEAELEELETLLASDYEAREHFLDHAQIEGMLHGAGREIAADNVVAIGGDAAVAAGSRFQWGRVAAATTAAAAAAAVLVLAAVAFGRFGPEGVPDTEPTAGVGAEGQAEAESPLAKLSPEERYDRSRTAEVGRASQAHPESADRQLIADDREIEFNRDIRPILSDNCFFCHGPDAAERKADLRLDTEQGATHDLGGYAAVVPGDAGASELVARITDGDPDSMMPPPESERSLTEKQKALLRRWIEDGAEWQRHWSFEPPEKGPLPEVSDPGWPANPVDHFVLHRLDEQGLEPSPEADRTTLIRRLSLDLTGLPPSVEEVDAFLADDSTDAYGKLVDRLLHSTAHAERMAWQWMEFARYADTDGYQNDGPREMWRWRDWVIEAYKSNMPYDRFTIEQLAGDLLPDPTRDQLIATGFNRNNRYNSESGLVLEEFLLENAADRVDTTMTVWMGLTMACARCHDHKYDPLTQKDYYQLVSFFDNITESGRAIKRGNSEPWIKAPTREQEARLAEIDYRLEEARKALKKANPGIAERQAEWEASAPEVEKPILPDGLEYHDAVEEPIRANGEKAVDLGEKIDGLVAHHRFSVAFDMTPGQVGEGAVLSNEMPDTRRRGIFVRFRDGHLRFAIVSRWIAGVGMLETERTFEPGERVHVALTNDGTQRTKGMGIWIDGEKVATRSVHNTNSNKVSQKSPQTMLVGGSRHLPAWKGRVSDLRFYLQRTLKAEEIAMLASPSSADAVLAKEADARTDTESALLRHYYLEHAADESDRSLYDRVAKIEQERLRFHDSLPTTMVMEQAPEPKKTHLRIRGEYDNEGEVVRSGVPEVFPSIPEDQPKNRLGLARWIVSDENPLAARVAVNHMWQMLFGRGLVKTAEDFGTQGSPPSHPDLLDWLAIEFRQSGWDVRHLLRTIVTSRTYRQSSAIGERHLAMDPKNVHLARAPRLKLSGNVLRDQALSASGLLVDDVGGPPVKPYQPANLWKEASNFRYEQDDGEDLYRRSLYTYWKRTLAPPSMSVLDASDREWCSVKPKRTNTPLQALALLNETAFFEAARKLGERMWTRSDASAKEKITWGFRTVLSRRPEEKELKVLTDAYRSYREKYAADPKEARAVRKVGEAPVEAEVDPVDLAAATAVANVILNLEEASVRE